jgi:hypothetical protein
MPTREQRARRLGVPIDQLPDGRGSNPRSHANSPKGAKHYRWNSGRIVSEEGYTKVRVGVSHPLADPNGYAYEHLVVWCAAGRPPLTEGWVIHHRNHDKADNRLENLEIKQRGTHAAEHLAEEDRRCPATGRLLAKAFGPRHGLLA